MSTEGALLPYSLLYTVVSTEGALLPYSLLYTVVSTEGALLPYRLLYTVNINFFLQGVGVYRGCASSV